MQAKIKKIEKSWKKCDKKVNPSVKNKSKLKHVFLASRRISIPNSMGLGRITISSFRGSTKENAVPCVTKFLRVYYYKDINVEVRCQNFFFFSHRTKNSRFLTLELENSIVF